MSLVDNSASEFINLFGGLGRINEIGAFGTGKGEWVKRGLTLDDVAAHLTGEGSGIGVPPLSPDNKVAFAAIDLDEPSFDAARDMQTYIPGRSFVERSRSGNAHVWVFFTEPLEAWIAMGILKEAVFSAGKEGVEVFPKNHDFAKVKYGNYINLPYFDDERPIIVPCQAEAPGHGQCDFEFCESGWNKLTLDIFLMEAYEGRNDPEDWRKRARWLSLDPPDSKRAKQEFGTLPKLHMCAEYIIANRDENPLTDGHRNAVFFALAKQLTNCSMFDHDEALDMMKLVNESAVDSTPESEIRRILANAERGQYTSTDCDNPLVAPFAHPDCPIANPRR